MTTTNETAGVKLPCEQDLKNWLIEQCERLAVDNPIADFFELSVKARQPQPALSFKYAVRISCMDFRRPDGESLVVAEGRDLKEAEAALAIELASPRKAFADKATKLREEAARLEKLAMEASA